MSLDQSYKERFKCLLGIDNIKKLFHVFILLRSLALELEFGLSSPDLSFVVVVFKFPPKPLSWVREAT